MNLHIEEWFDFSDYITDLNILLSYWVDIDEDKIYLESPESVEVMMKETLKEINTKDFSESELRKIVKFINTFDFQEWLEGYEYEEDRLYRIDESYQVKLIDVYETKANGTDEERFWI